MVNTLLFDPGATDVLQAAKDLAVQRGEERIGPHVLLVALGEAGPAPIQAALSRFGFGATKGREWLDGQGEMMLRAPFDTMEPYSRRSRAILDMAAAEATEADLPEIRAVDLLFGILREPFSARGIAGAALVARGATASALHAALDEETD